MWPFAASVFEAWLLSQVASQKFMTGMNEMVYKRFQMPAQDWKPSISALVLELGAKTIMAIWQSKALGLSGG